MFVGKIQDKHYRYAHLLECDPFSTDGTFKVRDIIPKSPNHDTFIYDNEKKKKDSLNQLLVEYTATATLTSSFYPLIECTATNRGKFSLHH